MSILSPSYSWADFIAIWLFLLLLYFILIFFRSLLDKFQFLGTFQPVVRICVHLVLLIYEPIALLTLSSVFILINPKVHGVFALLTGFFGASYIKSYISGRFIQRDSSLVKGRAIKTKDLSGVVYGMEKFGLQLQTNRGLHFVSYSKMLEDGYTILAGEQVGGFFNLVLTVNEEESKINHVSHLMDMFVTTPYILSLIHI